MKKLSIIIEATDRPDALLATANLLLMFRKMGLHSSVVGDQAAVMRLGSDEWSCGNELVKLVNTDGMAIELVESPAPAPKLSTAQALVLDTIVDELEAYIAGKATPERAEQALNALVHLRTELKA